jgi:hypothetical protein
MKIDLRGHDIYLPSLEHGMEHELRMKKHIEENYPSILKENYPLYPHSYCAKCGSTPSFVISVDGSDTYRADTECAYKDGFPPIEAMLEVPSGEILLFNDFRKFYEKESDMIDINNTLGIKQYTEHYAKQGMAMHFISNTCASVAQISDKRLEIGYFECDKEENCEYEECSSSCPEYVEVNIIGSICTDLWWYCAVDKDAFEKRIGKTVEQFQEEYHATGAWPKVVRAKVIPGTYRTVGQYHIDQDHLFSYIEKME